MIHCRSVILFFSIALMLSACEPESQQETENRIAKWPPLTRLNALCEGLPKVPTVELKYKRIGGNSEGSSITFFYSKKVPFKEAEEKYKDWLEENGWVENKRLISSHYGYYKKDKAEIVIQYVDAESMATTCMESD